MNHHTTPTPQPERRAKHRADRSAAAATTTACSSCTTATGMHRAHYPVCNANQCKQGHQPCPTPQACQLPDSTGTTDEAPATLIELAGLWMVMGWVFAGACSILVISCASA